MNGRAQSDADGQNLGPLPRMTGTAGTGQDAAGGQGPSERDIGVGTGPGDKHLPHAVLMRAQWGHDWPGRVDCAPGMNVLVVVLPVRAIDGLTAG